MHIEQQEFCKRVATRFPEFFSKVCVLDCGSMDVNGTNEYLFTQPYVYIGVDIGPGPNVHIVSPVSQIVGSYDCVISTEMLEHDESWRDSLRNMYRVLKPGGMLIITCATDPRAEHGTRKCNPEASPHTTDYYHNISREEFSGVIESMVFLKSELFSNQRVGDLYFWGIKL